MKVLTLLFLLVAPLLQTGAADVSLTSPGVCTQVEKVYSSYQFGRCRQGLINTWCYKGDTMSKYQAKFFKEYQAGPPVCTGYQTTCEYLRFLTQECGASYTKCHDQEERKLIMRIWIKQFLREVVYRPGRFEDDGVPMKTGKCNDILNQYFDENELKEILDMIESPDFEKEGWPRGYNFFTNITSVQFGVLKDEDGNDINIADMSEYISINDSRRLTLPSHWEYCEYMVARHLVELSSNILDLWRCDGKCNTNVGDDQAWFKTIHGKGGMYRDLNTGEFHGEQYRFMHELRRNYSGETMAEKGVFGCLDDANNIYREENTCKRFETFVENCSAPIDMCLGNIAIKEVVMTQLVREFGTFTLEECTEVSLATLVSYNWMCGVIWLLMGVLCFI